jgi:hypothetical protein
LRLNSPADKDDQKQINEENEYVVNAERQPIASGWLMETI